MPRHITDSAGPFAEYSRSHTQDDCFRGTDAGIVALIGNRDTPGKASNDLDPSGRSILPQRLFSQKK